MQQFIQLTNCSAKYSIKTLSYFPYSPDIVPFDHFVVPQADEFEGHDKSLRHLEFGGYLLSLHEVEKIRGTYIEGNKSSVLF